MGNQKTSWKSWNKARFTELFQDDIDSYNEIADISVDLTLYFTFIVN